MDEILGNLSYTTTCYGLVPRQKLCYKQTKNIDDVIKMTIIQTKMYRLFRKNDCKWSFFLYLDIFVWILLFWALSLNRVTSKTAIRNLSVFIVA